MIYSICILVETVCIRAYAKCSAVQSCKTDNFEVDFFVCFSYLNYKAYTLAVFSSGSFCQIYRVTDEAFIAETAIWPKKTIGNGITRYLKLYLESNFKFTTIPRGDTGRYI